MRLEYDPVAEDFLLIDQGRVIERVWIPFHLNSGGVEGSELEAAYELLRKLKRPARSTDPARTSIDKPTPAPYDETLVKRFKQSGAPLLDLPDIELDMEDLL